jgi:hypothetical protein
LRATSSSALVSTALGGAWSRADMAGARWDGGRIV